MDTCQRGRLGKQGDQPSAGAQQEQGGEFEGSLGGSLALVGTSLSRAREVVRLRASKWTDLACSKTACWGVMERKPGRKVGSSQQSSRRPG